MVVLFVVLTFAVFLTAGMILERRENRERKAARELRKLNQQPVFSQDGGEPIDKEAAHEEVEKDA